VLAAAFSPDGRRLAVSDARGSVTVWDPETGTRVTRLEGLHDWTQALAWSPDGTQLAAADVVTPRLRAWDVARGTTTFAADVGPSSLAYSPDGRLLASAAMEDGLEVRDARTGRVVATLEDDAEPRSAAFSPDGRLLFTGLLNGEGRFYSTRDWSRSGATIRGQDQRLTSAQFTPDGRTLVTGSADGTAMLWDVAGRKPIGAPITVQPDAYISTALSPDGRYLFALPSGHTGLRLDLSPKAWTAHACRIAGRELTGREWSEAAPEQPYRRVCT
jgi:WD40 repeat protein